MSGVLGCMNVKTDGVVLRSQLLSMLPPLIFRLPLFCLSSSLCASIFISSLVFFFSVLPPLEICEFLCFTSPFRLPPTSLYIVHALHTGKSVICPVFLVFLKPNHFLTDLTHFLASSASPQHASGSRLSGPLTHCTPSSTGSSLLSLHDIASYLPSYFSYRYTFSSYSFNFLSHSLSTLPSPIFWIPALVSERKLLTFTLARHLSSLLPSVYAHVHYYSSITDVDLTS